MRLPFPDTWPLRASLDVSARLPTSSAALFPYSTGAQDIEVSATLSIPALMRMHLGAGRIFAEPPSGSSLTRADIPHATHIWTSFSAHRGAWWVAARGDLLLFDIDSAKRGVGKLAIGWRDPDAFLVIFDWCVDFGSRENRVFDHGPTLRFATPLL